MAANPAQQIIELGRALEAALPLVERSASLEQACRETESRLASLRDEESRAGASITAAHLEAQKIKKDAEAAASRVLHDADRGAAAAILAGADAVAAAEADAANKLADLDEQLLGKRRAVSILEKEEAALGQSVAALRSDLAAIRAKLG